jgi:hypothetical protein
MPANGRWDLIRRLKVNGFMAMFCECLNCTNKLRLPSSPMTNYIQFHKRKMKTTNILLPPVAIIKIRIHTARVADV